MKYKIVALLLVSFGLFNCSSDESEVEENEIVEEEMVVVDENGDGGDETGGDGDTGDGDVGGIEMLITYEKDVEPIMAGNCYTCHGQNPTNGTATSLFTFDEVSALSGMISDRINARGNNASMPPFGLLNTNVIAVIDQWIVDGLLEN